MVKTISKDTKLWLEVLAGCDWNMTKAREVMERGPAVIRDKASNATSPAASRKTTASKPTIAAATAPMRRTFSLLDVAARNRAQAIENRDASAAARRNGELDLQQADLDALWSDQRTRDEFGGNRGRFEAFWKATRRGQVRR